MSQPHVPVRRDREGEEVDQQEQQEQQQTSSNSNVTNIQAERFKNGCGLTLMEAIEQYNNHNNGGSNGVSDLPPRFSGLLKERYSDFIVRERAPTPLQLICLTVPENCKDPEIPKVEDYRLPTEEKMRQLLTEVLRVIVPNNNNNNNNTSAANNTNNNGNDDAAVLPEQKQQQEEKEVEKNDVDFLIAALQENPQIDRVTLPTRRTEKLSRAKIHQALKQCGFVESGTTSNDEIFIVANPKAKNGGGGGGGKNGPFAGRAGGQTQYQQNGALINRVLWPKNRGEHLHFTLYKENLESGAALRQIAGRLGIPLRMLMYCGNKDKRAVTTQRISCRFLSAQSVAKLNGMSYGRTSLVRLGDFEYKTDQLQLGRLLGNGFTITLRRVNDEAFFAFAQDPQAALAASLATEASLKRCEQFIAENGFVNYFGPQRFGTTGIPSYEVGKALLRCDYAAALLLCFESKAQIAFDFIPALQAYRDEKDVAKALKLTPYHCTFERDALIALNSASRQTDIQRAILALPRPLTMLYCHSVQSLVWNTMVSERLRLAPVVLEGDMVLLDNSDNNNLAAFGGDDAEDVAENNNNNQDQQQQQQNLQQDASASSPTTTTEVGAAKESPLPRVHFVTKEDIQSKKYKLSDVLLPIPGNDPDLQFPQNEISGKDAYIKVMHQDLEIGDSLLKANEFTEKRFHIHGAYRHMIVVPENFSLKLVTYSSNDELLVESDFQKIMKRDAASVGEFNPNKILVANTGDAADQTMTERPKRFAVIASFELPAGAYATSVLREMCDAVSDSRLVKN